MTQVSEVFEGLNSSFELCYKLYRSNLVIGYDYACSLDISAHQLAKSGMTSRAIFVAVLPGSSNYCSKGKWFSDEWLDMESYNLYIVLFDL